MKKTLIILGLCVAALSILGILILYSTGFTQADSVHFQSQLKCLGVGVVLMLCAARLGYGSLQQRDVQYALGGLGALLLIAVFIPGVGMRLNGASRWVHGLGQPSEFVKPIVVILLAGCLARMGERQIENFKKEFLPTLLLGGVPAFLVFAEPDWGTATLLIAVTLSMLLLAGARWPQLAVTVTIGATLFALLVACNPVRLARILVFLGPEASQHGSGWQVWQSVLDIGAGGPMGNLLHGSIHKYGFVPEQQTDFIFATIGQETGFWGTSLVVMLYLGIFLCGLHIMKHARDRFGYYLAAGCTTLIVLQAFINIAVATSLVPNKGLPLPFISCGGSSLLSMFVCVGLLAGVGVHSGELVDLFRSPRSVTPAAVQLVLL